MLHSSYSFALAFEAETVSTLLQQLGVQPPALVLDPFCGTGTTLLESKIAGFNAIGVDANPVCALVSRAKTNWTLNAEETYRVGATVTRKASRKYASYTKRTFQAKQNGSRQRIVQDRILSESKIGRYLLDSGLLRRGWISPTIALKTLTISEEIRKLPPQYRDFLLLSLLGLLVPELSNMAYGPEIYRKRHRRDRNVFTLFESRVKDNTDKLIELKARFSGPRGTVRLGDSTNGGLSFIPRGTVDAIISSPPYLSDHDYSRLTRLELVFAGFVTSSKDLRRMKKQLLRSSSKNVYTGDCLADRVRHVAVVQEAIAAVSSRAKTRSSGFARVYPRLVGEYFGGMHAHFQAAARVLRPGGRAAYIVGDQSSFFALPIPTAHILASVAQQCGVGLKLESMRPIRNLRGTRGSVHWTNPEWVMVLRKQL